MEKKKYLFLILSLLGVLLVLYLSAIIEPNLITINSSTNYLNKNIKIQAEIRSLVNPTPQFYIIRLQDSTGEITGIMNLNQNPSSLKNKTCIIQGKIIAYKNSTELSMNKISSCFS